MLILCCVPRCVSLRLLQLNAQSIARLRKTDLMHGGVAAQFERVHLRRVEPVVLKGHKREKEVIERSDHDMHNARQREQQEWLHQPAEQPHEIDDATFLIILCLSCFVVLCRFSSKKRIVAAMVDMESRIEDHHKAERARRVRPTFFQLITGKKPSGVIAAEEAAIKERKEKAKAAEKARQAKQNSTAA